MRELFKALGNTDIQILKNQEKGLVHIGKKKQTLNRIPYIYTRLNITTDFSNICCINDIRSLSLSEQRECVCSL